MSTFRHRIPWGKIFFGYLLSLMLFSCRKEKTPDPEVPGDASLVIRHFSLGEKAGPGITLEDSAGTKLNFTKLQYYVSDIRLETENPFETYRDPEKVHLVRGLDNAGEFSIRLWNLPPGNYRSLVLNIGLDSVTNHQSNGAGDLNPGFGMYWSWSGEYKFMVLEGEFQSTDSSGTFLFHMAGEPCFRSIVIPLNDASGNFPLIRPGSTILLNAEISSLFGAPNPVDFRQMNNVMSIASGAGKIADNYQYGGFIRLAGFR